MIDFIPDHPIAFNRDFVALGVGITGALFLSQCVYWSKRTAFERDGWFYKTQQEWEEETGMTRREQETARTKLVNLGFLEEKKQGIPCKVWFRLNAKVLLSALNNAANKSALMRQTSMAESAKLDCTNAPYCDGGKRQTNTEITAENTTQITTDIKTIAQNAKNQTQALPAEAQALLFSNSVQSADFKKASSSEDASISKSVSLSNEAQTCVQKSNMRESELTKNKNTAQKLKNASVKKEDCSDRAEILAAPSLPDSKLAQADYLIKTYGIDAQIATDYMKQRKKAHTLTSLKMLEKQAQQAGISVAEAIKFCAGKSWDGFYVESYLKETQNNQQKKKQGFSLGCDNSVDWDEEARKANEMHLKRRGGIPMTQQEEDDIPF